MTKFDGKGASSTVQIISTSVPQPTVKDDSRVGIHYESDSPSYTDTIAAVTVAVLAVVLLLTLLVIFKALRKRQRARQGQRLDDIPTISGGIMGSGVLAYSNIPVAGRITWESVSETDTTSSTLTSRGDNSTPQNPDHQNRRSYQDRERNFRSSQQHRS